MNKRRYRTTDVNRVNWERVSEQAAGEARMVFAVDVAKEKFVAALMKADGTVVEMLKWCHPGQTAQMLKALMAHVSASVLEVAMEPSGTYGDVLLEAFRRRAVAVYRLSPKRVHDSAEVFDGVPSLHDAKAAYQIGRLHLAGVSRHWEARSVQRRELAAQISLLKLYQGRLSSSTNRLEAQLARHWPELPRVLEPGSVTLARLVASFGSAAQVAAEAEAARALMRRSGRAGLAAEKIEAVIETARHSLGVPPVAAEQTLLQTLAEDLLANLRAVQRLEKALAEWVRTDPTATRCAALVGPTTAAVLLETLGEPQDYPAAGSYLKAAGLNLKERSSGKHCGQLKITKRGPGIARQYLYFAALRWLYQDPIIQAWYQRKVAHDGGQKGQAIVAIMRKLTKALWHLARGGEFDSRKLFNCHALVPRA